MYVCMYIHEHVCMCVYSVPEIGVDHRLKAPCAASGLAFPQRSTVAVAQCDVVAADASCAKGRQPQETNGWQTINVVGGRKGCVKAF